MKKTRILLADDHTLMRAGIRTLLEKQDDMEVVGEAAEGREALQKVAEFRPDVVLMDIAMPGMDGMEATKRIKSQYPDVQILALTMLEDERYFFQIVQAGALGFLIKGALPDELLSAVRAVAAGNVYLYPALAKTLLHESASQPDTDCAAGRRWPDRAGATDLATDLRRPHGQRDRQAASDQHPHRRSSPREPDGEAEPSQPHRAGEVRHPQGPDRPQFVTSD